MQIAEKQVKLEADWSAGGRVLVTRKREGIEGWGGERNVLEGIVWCWKGYGKGWEEMGRDGKRWYSIV